MHRRALKHGDADIFRVVMKNRLRMAITLCIELSRNANSLGKRLCHGTLEHARVGRPLGVKHLGRRLTRYLIKRVARLVNLRTVDESLCIDCVGGRAYRLARSKVGRRVCYGGRVAVTLRVNAWIHLRFSCRCSLDS
jgi:hypothetical protein